MSFRLKFPTNAFHFKRSRSGSEHSLCNKRRQTCLGFSSFSGSRIDNLNICLLTLIIEVHVFWPQNWKYSWKPNKTEDPWILVFLTSVLTGSQWFLSEQFFTGQSHGPRKRRPVTIWPTVALNNDDDTHEFIPCAYSTEPCSVWYQTRGWGWVWTTVWHFQRGLISLSPVHRCWQISTRVHLKLDRCNHLKDGRCALEWQQRCPRWRLMRHMLSITLVVPEKQVFPKPVLPCLPTTQSRSILEKIVCSGRELPLLDHGN